MDLKKKERRIFRRFEIPEATLSYKISDFSSASQDYEEKNCPILDLCLGGLKYLTQKNLKISTKLTIKISCPEKEGSFYMSGKVKWTISNPGFTNKYQVGIQFDAYGDKEEINSSKEYAKIKRLEWKYGKKGKK